MEFALSTARETVARIYKNITFVDAPSAVLNSYTVFLEMGVMTVDQVVDAIIQSPAAQSAGALIRVYQAAFGRVPDITGMTGFLQTGADFSKLGPSFVSSQEWANRYGGSAVNEAMVQALYVNVLGRTGSANEVKFWLNWALTGTLTTEQILFGFVNSAEFVQLSGSSIVTLLTAAGKAQTADELAAVYNGTDPLRPNFPVTSFMLKATVDQFEGTEGRDTVYGTLDGTATETFQAFDEANLKGGEDTLHLSNSAGTMTLPTVTKITSVEHLVLRSGANAVTADVQGASYKDLRTITVEQAGTKAAIDIDTKAGVTSVTVKGGTTVAIDDNGAAGTDKLTTVSLDGNTGAASIASDALTKLSLANTSATATVTAAAGTRALTLTVNAASSATITDNEATSAKIIGTGTASSSVTLNLGKAAALEFAGTKENSYILGGAQPAGLTITSTSSGGTKINTALNTDVTFTGGDGKDTVTVGATTKAIQMGKGDDTVTVNGGTIGTGGKIDGGLGTDTLALAPSDAISVTTSTAFASKVKGFEVLQLSSTVATGTVNLANLNTVSTEGGDNAINKVVFASGPSHALTISGLSSGSTLEYRSPAGAAVTADITGALTGSADVLNIGLTATYGIGAGTVNAANVEIVNILSDDSATTPTGISHSVTLAATSASKITVSGDAGLTLSFSGTKLTSFDASGMTKGGVDYATHSLENAATLTGGAGNDVLNAGSALKTVTLNGGAGNDTLRGSTSVGSTLNGGDGNDTMIGGSGADILDGGAGDDTIHTGTGADKVSTGAGTDTIVISANTGVIYAWVSDMAKGDKIDFLSGGTATFNAQQIKLADTASLRDYLDAAAASTSAGTNSAVSWFQLFGQTFLVQDRSNTAGFNDSTDQIIQLAGEINLVGSTISGNTDNILTIG
jgi:S-layer protein